jgi:hypothetical protein
MVTLNLFPEHGQVVVTLNLFLLHPYNMLCGGLCAGDGDTYYTL